MTRITTNRTLLATAALRSEEMNDIPIDGLGLFSTYLAICLTGCRMDVGLI